MPDTQSSKGKTIKQFPEASEINNSDAFLVHGELEYKHITFQNLFNLIKEKICNIITIMTGATSDSDGKSGLVPTPTSADHGLFLRGDGTWNLPTKADIALENVPNVTTDNQTPSFIQATERENIASKETLSTLFGKIKKWFSDLSSVAFSGDYDDLSNTPTIPVVNDATLTIQKNGETINSFTANQKDDEIVNMIVPTKVSELENDSEFKTTDTWKANTKDTEGYVEKSAGQIHKVWGTDEEGKPGWRDEKDTTYNKMTGATASSSGVAGLVPPPKAGEQNSFLRADGTWAEPDVDMSDALTTSGNASNTYVNFSQAVQRANINSGDSLAIAFGKLAKFCADLQTVAFSGSYNDLSNKPSIPTHVSQLVNDSGYKTTDTNTWRGIQDNLSSYSTTESLSANQGRVLNSAISTLNSKLGSVFIPIEHFSGGTLDNNTTYNYSKIISGNRLVITKVGLVNFNNYVTWQVFPSSNLGEKVEFTCYENSTAWYNVAITFNSSALTISASNRGSNWTGTHIYVKIYSIGL